MSFRNPFGWDLPPGCTDKDIDDHFGGPNLIECPDCDGDGKVMDDGAPDAVPVKCSRCDGTGEIEKPTRELDDFD